jgi:hypothetical protein
MAKGKHTISLFEVSRKDSAKGLSYKKPAEQPKIDISDPPPTTDRTNPNIRISRLAAFLLCMGVLFLVFGAYVMGQRNAANPPIAQNPDPQLTQMQEGVTVVNNAYDPAMDKSAVTSTADPIAVNKPMGRTVGLNYIIAQSYSKEEMKLAEDAVAFLKQNNIQATIEKSPKRLNLPLGWVSVITTTGFDKISTPPFTDYIKKIKSISDKNTKRKSFASFSEPQAYKWDTNN